MAPTRTLSLMLLATWLAAPAAADGIAWRSDLEAAKREAAGSGRLVLLHFSGPSCQPCRMMEQTVFNRADVARAVEQDFVPVAVDTKENPRLAQQYGVRPIPADVIVGPDGQVINRSVGAKSAHEYVAALAHVARLAPRAPSGRQAAAGPGPAGNGRPAMNSGLAAAQPATPPAGSYQLTAPAAAPAQARGASAQARGAIGPPTRPQASPLAPRVAQQHVHERMLQPPPAPGTGHPGAAGRAAAPPGPPAYAGNGSATPAWRQQHLAGAGQSAGPSASPGVVGNPFAGPAGNAAAGSAPQPSRGPLATPSWGAPAAAYPPPPNTSQPAPPAWSAPGPAPPQAGAATAAASAGTPPPRAGASPLTAPPLGPRPRTGAIPTPPAAAPQAQAAAPSAPTAAPSAPAAAPPGQSVAPPIATTTSPAPGAISPAPAATSAAPVAPSPAPGAAPPATLPAPAATPLAPAATPPAPGAAPSSPTATPSAPAAPPPAPSTPPVAFGGYCCVTMHHEGRWVAGDRRWGVIHEGRLYLFVSEQAKEAFWREAERYAPVFSGDDVVLFVDTGKRVPGQVRIGAKQGEPEARTYLFADEESYQKFYWNAASYIERLRQLTGGTSGR